MSYSLSKYFSAIAAKRLSQVEVHPKVSNQHEFNGIKGFKNILGVDRATFQSTFIRLTDDTEKAINESGSITWYNSRERSATRSPEYRLYYSPNEVIKASSTGDLLIVGKMTDNKLAVITAAKNSTSEDQLLWLFGLSELGNDFILKDFSDDHSDIGFAGRYILSSLGFEVEETAPDYLDQLLRLFGKSFPSTKVFSDFARSTIKDVSPVEEPDKTLMTWLSREELLFKTLESEIVKDKLEAGFGKDGKDVDEFIKFSLSVQNRRKARAGFAFENNLALIFRENLLSFSHGAVTERNNKPDFLFPGSMQYHQPDFNPLLLTMLGVKTTAKDRWRQILSEAGKIPRKHLITLEPAISRNQTEDMIANNIQLVIPAPLFRTYNITQQANIFTVQDFINKVKIDQKGNSQVKIFNS
jgi:hypothetical protein